jgi:hypothetical protein
MRRLSRYRFCTGRLQPDGSMMLSDREPFRFQPFPDTVVHTAQLGDTWHNLAFEYYDGIAEDSSDLYFVICDFQPTPVVDPTIPPQPGDLIYIPSAEVLISRIFSNARKAEHR